MASLSTAFLRSGACSVGAGHHSCSQEPVNQRRGGGKKICVFEIQYFSPIFN